jgi:glycosyltransferase involved in cell wall biosynthesis
MGNACKISSNLSSKILTIGPDYHNHRGGIEAVIEIYSKYYESFKFLATYKEGSVIFKSLIFFFSIFSFLKKNIFDKKIRIIHIHGASYGSFVRKFICFLIAKYLFKKKIIYHIHGAEFHLFYSRSNVIIKKAISAFINKSDCIICLSSSWMTFFKTNFNPRKIEIVPNIIDFPSFSTIKKKDSVITFLFLGLIGNRKGIFDLIQVISQNKCQYENKIKLIIGGNGEVEKLKDLIEELQLKGIVEFVGWITKEEKNNWLRKSDVYILPSYNEGLPISILEAMSYGQAIISTNVGGIPEVVLPNENGIIIEAGNLNEIENAINFFIHNPGKVDPYGRASRKISEKYQPDFVINKLTAIYQSILVNE